MGLAASTSFVISGLVASEGHLGHHVAQEIAGQRQLGKHDQIGPLPFGGLDLFQMLRQIALPISQRRRDLGQGHAQLGAIGGGL